MIFKSEHITQASGSIAGVTYSRAKGGTLYRRARAIPVNPDTTFQTQVRSALTSLVNSWISVVTAAQRTAWNTYGQNVLVTNKLGDSVALSGQNWYIAANTPRLQAITKLSATIAQVDAAPTIFDRGDFTTPTITSADTDSVNIAFDNTDAWANEDDAALLLYMGRPRNPSRSFFKGPYRLIQAIEGDSVTPPTSPSSLTAAAAAASGFPLVEDQVVRFAVAVTRADGRISTRRSIGDATIVAP